MHSHYCHIGFSTNCSTFYECSIGNCLLPRKLPADSAKLCFLVSLLITCHWLIVSIDIENHQLVNYCLLVSHSQLFFLTLLNLNMHIYLFFIISQVRLIFHLQWNSDVEKLHSPALGANQLDWMWGSAAYIYNSPASSARVACWVWSGMHSLLDGWMFASLSFC